MICKRNYLESSYIIHLNTECASILLFMLLEQAMAILSLLSGILFAILETLSEEAATLRREIKIQSMHHSLNYFIHEH